MSELTAETQRTRRWDGGRTVKQALLPRNCCNSPRSLRLCGKIFALPFILLHLGATGAVAVVYDVAIVGGRVMDQAAGAKDLHEPATPEQLHRMAQLADAAMRQGAFGVGFGVEYIPGTSGDEVTTLAAVAARYRGNLHAHIRLPHLLDPFQGINEL